VLPGVGRDAKYVVKHLVARPGSRLLETEVSVAA